MGERIERFKPSFSRETAMDPYSEGYVDGVAAERARCAAIARRVDDRAPCPQSFSILEAIEAPAASAAGGGE